ncbi:hypothetical protein MCEKH45_01357 [Methylophilaceae bacterium]|jgi:hypothetical protein
MRSCVIKIDTEEYVPVRALPFCTAGQFTPSDVIDLLTDLESHADSTFSANVVPFVVANGSLIYQSPNALFRFRSHMENVIANGGTFLEQVAALPPEMVVKAVDMRDFNEFLDNLTISNETIWSKSHNNNFTWLDAPFMTTEEEALVFEGFEKLNTTQSKKPRKNDKSITFQKIQLALNKVMTICRSNNIAFSKDSVPGFKRHLLDCFKLIDPTIAIAETTFDGKNYVGKLQLKWIQGEKAKSGEEMVAAVKQAMGVI